MKVNINDIFRNIIREDNDWIYIVVKKEDVWEDLWKWWSLVDVIDFTDTENLSIKIKVINE